MAKKNAKLPNSAIGPTWVRLFPEDREFAHGIAMRKGVSLSVWLRMVIMERLEQERKASAV